jgi:hypothetical protein
VSKAESGIDTKGNGKMRMMEKKEETEKRKRN